MTTVFKHTFKPLKVDILKYYVLSQQGSLLLWFLLLIQYILRMKGKVAYLCITVLLVSILLYERTPINTKNKFCDRQNMHIIYFKSYITTFQVDNKIIYILITQLYSQLYIQIVVHYKNENENIFTEINILSIINRYTLSIHTDIEALIQILSIYASLIVLFILKQLLFVYVLLQIEEATIFLCKGSALIYLFNTRYIIIVKCKYYYHTLKKVDVENPFIFRWIITIFTICNDRTNSDETISIFSLFIVLLSMYNHIFVYISSETN